MCATIGRERRDVNGRNAEAWFGLRLADKIAAAGLQLMRKREFVIGPMFDNIPHHFIADGLSRFESRKVS